MIDFELSENDRKILDAVREQALICREHARYYDENEHEFPPDALPGADDYPSPYSLMNGDKQNTALPVMAMLVAAGETWGDYSVRMRRGKGALGNAALRASGTPEQQQKWGHTTLAMAITEPGCGSDPSRVQTTAVLGDRRRGRPGARRARLHPRAPGGDVVPQRAHALRARRNHRSLETAETVKGIEP